MPIKTDLLLPWPIESWSNKTEVTNASSVVLLLHGFRQRGFWIYRRLQPIISGKVALLSPNGLFPIPVQVKEQWRMGYSWYFFDPKTGKYFTEMQRAVDYLKIFLESQGYSGQPITIIGFSQGGYLAPYLAKELKNCHQVIAIGSRFRSEDLTEKYHFRFDAIHGKEDSSVEFARSEKCHQEIIGNGNTGEFIALENTAHEINDQVLLHCQTLLQPSADGR